MEHVCNFIISGDADLKFAYSRVLLPTLSEYSNQNEMGYTQVHQNGFIITLCLRKVVILLLSLHPSPTLLDLQSLRSQVTTILELIPIFSLIAVFTHWMGAHPAGGTEAVWGSEVHPGRGERECYGGKWDTCRHG